jgi:hypothetical protein
MGPGESEPSRLWKGPLSKKLTAACTVPEEHVVAVMTHGAVLAAILSFSESVRPLRPTDVRCANLEVLEIAVDPTKGWSVRRRHSPLTFG